jgi:nucleobase transporter 1/2
MAPVKAEELVAFVPKEQYDGVDYCITSPPPWLTAVLLAFQHYLVMLGTTVIVATILVPLMGGGHVEKAIVVQTILFLAGINTLLQVHLGTRLPAVMGASYAYIYPAVAIILSPRFAIVVDPFERFVYTMRSLQGALIIAGVVQAIIGFFGIWRIFIRFLSPLAAVPFVTLSALGLFYFAFPGVSVLGHQINLIVFLISISHGWFRMLEH